MAKKQEIEVKIIIDTREKDRTLEKTFTIDKRMGKDKIKIVGIERKCFKALGCKTSTGDLGVEYRLKGEKRWRKTKLSVELKRKSDIFSTLYSNMKRFNRELDRAENNELDFYILHDWNFTDIKTHISFLQRSKRLGYNTQPFFTFLNNYLTISKKYPIICTDNFQETIRRIIKKHIKDYKLQY